MAFCAELMLSACVVGGIAVIVALRRRKRGVVRMTITVSVECMWGRMRLPHCAQVKGLVIPNPSLYASKRAQLLAGGISSLQVVADFDRTLTTAFTKTGEKLPRAGSMQ